jgi:hypothetical protein
MPMIAAMAAMTPGGRGHSPSEQSQITRFSV